MHTESRAVSANASDVRIRACIEEHLSHHPRYPGAVSVMVDVKDGDVTLSGTVPHRVMKQSIEETAAACPGVRRVDNHLNVPLVAPWPETEEPVDVADTR